MLEITQGQKRAHDGNQPPIKRRALKYSIGHQIRVNLACEEPSAVLTSILRIRGYNVDDMWITALSSSYCKKPTLRQLQDYDNKILDTIRKNDLEKLKTLIQEGRSMEACNIHCETLLHLAGRRASAAVMSLMLEHVQSVVVDDCGRTPLHDVCWRFAPNFHVARAVMDFDPSLMYVRDKYGACPLDYAPPSEWTSWNFFLHSVKDLYWPQLVVPLKEVGGGGAAG